MAGPVRDLCRDESAGDIGKRGDGTEDPGGAERLRPIEDEGDDLLDHGRIEGLERTEEEGLWRLRSRTVAQPFGEETGALDSTLAKVADYYEEQVEIAIKSLTSILEPVMIVVIGSIVGFMIIAMYLPMFDIYNQIH